MWFSLIVLIHSLGDFRTIPYAEIWGLDFQNLYAFHHCANGSGAIPSPYLMTGLDCHDLIGRNMIYPPSLYWSFFWVRAFDYEVARALYSIFLLFGIVGITFLWVRSSLSSLFKMVTLALCVAQFPTVFAFLRGNNDVLVVLLWSAACLAWIRRKWFWSGVGIGLAIQFKIYPLIAASVLGVSLLCSKKKSPVVHFAKWIGGATWAIAFGMIATYRDSVFYFSQTFWEFQKNVSYLPGLSHSLDALFPKLIFGVWVVRLALLAIWCRRGALSLKTHPEWVFAGALAISTYFSGTSFDYNLVTILPLTALVIARAEKTPWPILVLATVSFYGSRTTIVNAGSFFGPLVMQIQVLGQVVSLGLLGWLAPLEIKATQIHHKEDLAFAAH